MNTLETVITNKTEFVERPKRQKLKELATKWTLFVAAAFSIFALLIIFIFLLSRGIPAIGEIGFLKFLFGKVWDPDSSQYGLLPMILGSIYVTVFATIIGVVVGIFTAIFLHRFCHKKIVNWIRQMISILAGIPSVIFGLFGLLIIVPFIRENLSTNFVGHGILAASIILAIMIIPTIVSISLNSLHSVSKEFFEGALALGATVPQAEFKVVVPMAKNGLLAASVLSIGRALGETMAVIMVIGGSSRIPTSITQSINNLTALIARGALEASGLAFEALIAAGVVLFVFALLINFGFMHLKSRSDKKNNPKSKLKNSKTSMSGSLSLISNNIVKTTIMDVDYNGNATLKNNSFIAVPIINDEVFSDTRSTIDSNTNAHNFQKVKYVIFKVISYICAMTTIVALLSIIIFVFLRGTSSLSWNFIFGDYDVLNNIPTIKPALIGTIYLILISLVIAIPIGMATAIFMSEYIGNSRFIKYLRMAIETLASIPSIVYGLFGYILFGTILGWGYSLIGGGMTLAIMILPGIIRTTEESLVSVSNTYREASFALGASKVRTTFRVVLPQAASGVVTSLILAIGRVISESAVLILTIGMVIPDIPNSLFGPGTSLALDIFYFGNTGNEGAAAATAVVLIIFVIVINLLATLVSRLLSKNVKK